VNPAAKPIAAWIKYNVPAILTMVTRHLVEAVNGRIVAARFGRRDLIHEVT
jgi:hypothetical protein